MKCKFLTASIVGVVNAWLALNPQPAQAQILAVWGWRNIVAPEVGGPWIAPDVRFRPLGILDGDPIWRNTTINNRTLIIVNVPDERASVWIQGQLMQQTGRQRVFAAPALEPGLNYTYEIRVRWGDGKQAVDETRTVPIRLGQRVIVDFSRPAIEMMPPAKPQRPAG
jgi:uncharacterized protein (TIGR03000 family)